MVSPTKTRPSAQGTGTGTGKSAKSEKQQAPIPGSSVSQRYGCPVCFSHFCIDCDIFAHESLHSCPGCESIPANKISNRADIDAPGEKVNLQRSMKNGVAEATRMLEKSSIVVDHGRSMEIDN